ncbi:unnamed protein product [Rotaria sp. Silwood2]|nr:unnamed protein product [Rotaria sp. Silwood2]
MKDKKQGITVAGDQGLGNSLSQLQNSHGIIVNQAGIVYVADCCNNRIMRWSQKLTEKNVIIGRNGEGNQMNQLSSPIGLSFDRESSYSVCDSGNNRVPKFNID